MKKNSIILIAFLLLGGIFLFQEKNKPAQDTSGGYSKLFDNSLSASKVNSIEFFRSEAPDKGIHLVRKADAGDEWEVASRFNASASRKNIEKLLQGIKEMEGEVRTSDPELFSEFELSDNQGYRLILRNGDGVEMLHLLVGKKAATYTYGFVRIQGKEDVLVVDKEYRFIFGIYEESENREPDHSKWLNRNLLSLQSDTILSLSLEEHGIKTVLDRMSVLRTSDAEPPKERPHLVQPKDIWILKAMGAERIVPQEKATSLLSYISAFTFMDIISKNGKKLYGLDSPQSTLRVYTDRGVLHTLFLGSKNDARYYVQKKDDSTVYEVEGYVIENTFGVIRELGVQEVRS